MKIVQASLSKCDSKKQINISAIVGCKILEDCETNKVIPWLIKPAKPSKNPPFG